MICELLLKLRNYNMPTFISEPVTFINKIVNICHFKDKFKVLDIYTTKLNDLTSLKLTIDTGSDCLLMTPKNILEICIS